MAKNPKWSEEEIQYLREHYPGERAVDIGKHLGRSKLSVQHAAHNNGIKKSREAFFQFRSENRKGAKTPNYKGYRRKAAKGYYTRYVPEHPNATKDGLVMEHRLVMEEHLGFVIPKEFVVHHINGDKADNRIDNLCLMTNAAHTILHNMEDTKK